MGCFLRWLRFLLRVGLGLAWGSFRLSKGLTFRMLLGGVKADFGGCGICLELICVTCAAGSALALGLI